MNRTSIFNRQISIRGFVLVDVMLAMVIISVALIPICSMFIQAIHANAVARNYTVAANLAQKQLELLKLHPPEDWRELTLPCTIPWQDNNTQSSSQYILKTHATSYDANHHLVQVTVTALWQQRGIEYNLEFVTLYSAL